MLSRARHDQVGAAKRDQKQRYGAVDASTVVAAAARARKRAFQIGTKRRRRGDGASRRS